MKCISCEVEINPQWKHAIDMNVCPFCGKEIMEEHLKNLLASLSSTMDALKNYPQQLNDWMLSNHDYIKTDSPDIGKYMPVDMLQELKRVEDEKDFQRRKDNGKFTVKVKTEHGEEEVLAEKIQSEETTNDFFKRAEVIRTPSQQSGPQSGSSQYQSPTEKTQYLKKVAQQIKKEGSQGLTMSGGNIGIPAEMLDQADPDAVAEFQSMMSGGEIASSIDSGGDDDEIPAVVMAMANRNKGKSGQNAADLMKLQKLQEKQRASREAFESGENRESKGGGFSRV